MQKTVTAALLIIGNEILSGRTHDKNIPYIATKLNAAGIRLREVRVVADVPDAIIEAVNGLRQRYDYVFTTGGIGPTHDDITSENIAAAFGVKLVRHPEAERILRAHYDAATINEARLSMADMPEGATLIPNPVSSAPGFTIGNVHVMAGVPKICQAMVDWLIPSLTGGAPVLSVSITTNLPEGAIADGLTAIAEQFGDVDIGSYPNYKHGEFSTTLVVRSPDDVRNQAAGDAVRKLITAQGGRVVDEAPLV